MTKSFIAVLIGLLYPTVLHAGAYILTENAIADSLDTIVHPRGYTGQAVDLTIEVCVDPASKFATALDSPLRKAVATWNALTPTTGTYLPTGQSQEVPADHWDAESVLLHELGHCLGLQHGNLGARVLFFFTNATFSTEGLDGEFSFESIGPDGIWGSHDDDREDDENLFWYRKAVNDPFHVPTPPKAHVDSTSHARHLSSLPSSHLFAANGTPGVAQELGYASSKSVMYSREGPQSEFRSLVADDVDMVRYAMSGLDEVAGSGDDYTIQYQIVDFPCGLPVRFVEEITADGVGACTGVLSAPMGATDHRTFHPTEITLSSDPAFSWYFGPAPDLVITKGSSQTTIQPGEVLEFWIDLENSGLLDASGVEISDSVPDNTTFSPGLSDPNWNCQGTVAGSVCTLSIGALSAGSSTSTIVFTVQVDHSIPANVKEITNLVFAADDGANGPDADPSTNNAQVSIPVSAPIIFQDGFESGDTAAWDQTCTPTCGG